MTDTPFWKEFAQKTVRHEPSFFLQRALKLLEEKPRPRVKTAIDLGCGSGNDVLALLQAGWEVTALDISPENIELVQQRANDYSGALTAVQGDFTAMPRRKYGLVFAQRSLPFASHEMWDKTWQLIGRSVAVNGLVAAALFGPEDELLPAGRRILVSEAEAAKLLPGFKIEVLTELRQGGKRVRDGSSYQAQNIFLIARNVRYKR